MAGIDPRFFAPAQSVEFNPTLGSPNVALQGGLAESMLAAQRQADQRAQFQAEQSRLSEAEQSRSDEADANLRLREREFENSAAHQKGLLALDQSREKREQGAQDYAQNRQKQTEDEADFNAMYEAGSNGDLDRQRFIADKLRQKGYRVDAPDVRPPPQVQRAPAPPPHGDQNPDVVRSGQFLSEGDSFNQPGSPAAPTQPHEAIKQDIKKSAQADQKLSSDLEKGAESTIRSLKGGKPTVMPKAQAPEPAASAPAAQSSAAARL